MEEAWAFTLFILGVLLLVNAFHVYQLKELLMALSDDLNSVSAQLEKARDEITGEILDLEGALALAGDQPQEVTDAVAALKQVAQGLDDLVPDVSDLPVEPVVAPVEEAPVEEAPVEEAPVGDPVEVPVGEPVEDAPVVGQ